ncbi:hypothetical protein Tco_0415894 [Tanacetum coccineum]
MEVDIEEDENEPELAYPYEEVYPLNHPPPASKPEPKDVIKIESMVEPKDETVPPSVHKVGESSTTPFLREENDGLLPGLMRRDINSLFGRIASLSRRLCGREMEYALVKKKGKTKYEYYGKLILDLGNEVRSSVEEGTAAMENLVRKLGAVELRRWFEKTEMTFGISECVEDKKVKFAAATLRGPALTWWNSKVVILGLDVANQMGWTKMKKLITLEIVKPESVKVDAYIRGLSDNIKGEVTSSRPANLNEAVRVAHKLME